VVGTSFSGLGGGARGVGGGVGWGVGVDAVGVGFWRFLGGGGGGVFFFFGNFIKKNKN